MIFEINRPNSFAKTNLADQLGVLGVEGVLITGMKIQYCGESTYRTARNLGFDAVLIADGHTLTLKAEQIIAHRNAILAEPFCRVISAKDWGFNLRRRVAPAPIYIFHTPLT